MRYQESLEETMASGDHSNPRQRASRPAVLMQRFVTGVHSSLYRLSGGKIGGRMFGNPILLLTTTGRKTGKQRVTPLLYIPDGENMVLIASNGGAPSHPAWYWNLKNNPVAEVQAGGRKLRVRAEDADATERERLWPRAVSAFSGYAGYQQRTDREIPIVILRPLS
jgi:F420H(2)-dependent quinone reductase